VEFCETAAQLSLLATISAPPPALRNSVLSAISEVRVLPPILPAPSDTEANTTTEQALPSVPAQPSGAVPAPPSVSAPIDELALHRARRRTRVLSLAVAAAMVVALSLGGWVFSLNRAQQQQIASASAETQLFAAPDVKIYPVPLKSGGQASFVVSKQLDKALFVGKDLPDVGSQTFELWTVAAQSDPVPAGLVQGGGDRKQWFRGPITTSAALAVSLEKAGGAPAPTNIQADPTPIR
jgi:hypothetical protein